MKIPSLILECFPPSNQRLLDVTRQWIDDEMLLKIAEGDYGLDKDEHLEGLRPIRDQGIVQKPLPWCPHEVLELATHWQVEKPCGYPNDTNFTGLRGHQIRAFACAALLLAGTEYVSSMESLYSACLASSRVLGDEVNAAIACALTWEFQQLGDGLWSSDDHAWLYAIGLLLCMSRLNKSIPLAPTIGVTTGWLRDREIEWQRTGNYCYAIAYINHRWISNCLELTEYGRSGLLSSSVGEDLVWIGEMIRDRIELDDLDDEEPEKPLVTW